MKSKTRHEKISKFLNRKDCFYIGDKKHSLYHRKNCAMVDQITKNNLVACGPNPENSGFKPCHVCKPTPFVVYKEKDTGRSKAEIMHKAMLDIAERRGMYVEFIGENAVVTTVAGEWYFKYSDRPIQLHHKNTEQRYDRYGRSTGHYHIQKIVLESPMEALAYIYRHERAAETLAFGEPSK